jgi:hypothetical protein
MRNSNQRLFKTTSVGFIAKDILSKDLEATVWGVTSKGIFIITSSKWLVFLSNDVFRGPLTVSLDNANLSGRHASKGDPVYITSHSILLPETDIKIDIKDCKVWRPPRGPTILLDDHERRQKIYHIAKEANSKKDGTGFNKFLPHLLGSTDTQPAPRFNINIEWIDILQLQYLIRNREAVPLARQLSNILGSGEGLTPSADDFIIGLLLSLNRWKDLLWDTDNLRDLNVHVVEAAYQKTTSLSANLIECATYGAADERLINALDWLVTGLAREPEIVAHLLGWGNSSGVDAFIGMAVTLNASSEFM